MKIIAVDMGIKYNQIRCLLSCGVHVKVVPWNYDFVPELISKGKLFCLMKPINSCCEI